MKERNIRRAPSLFPKPGMQINSPNKNPLGRHWPRAIIHDLFHDDRLNTVP
jgi:hypothetical protein